MPTLIKLSACCSLGLHCPSAPPPPVISPSLKDNFTENIVVQVETAQAFNPTLVNSHSLKDYFTEDMAAEFFAKALAWQAEKGYR
jgi:hypothetical protein